MRPELSHFDGYFHLFAALDLAWAGWDQFRTTIDDKILKISKTVKPDIEKEISRVKNKMIVLQADEERLSQRIRNNIDAIDDVASEELQNISDSIQNNKYPSEIFKSMFLFAGIYCVLFLIVAGFQQFLSSEVTTNNILLFMHISSIYIVIVFFVGYFVKNTGYSISPIVPVLIAVILMTSCHYYCKFDDSNIASQIIIEEANHKVESNIKIAIFIAVLPYLLHFFRVYSSKIGNWFKYRWVDFTIRRKIIIVEYQILFAYEGKIDSMFLKTNILFPLRYIKNEIFLRKKEPVLGNDFNKL